MHSFACGTARTKNNSTAIAGLQDAGFKRSELLGWRTNEQFSNNEKKRKREREEKKPPLAMSVAHFS
jgi:hypothetical protein